MILDGVVTPTTLIGGTGAGAGNIIAFTTAGPAVDVTRGFNYGVLGNSIFGNADLGIDLGGDGVTLNDIGDGDSGPNNLQNFPVLTSAVSSAMGTVIQGTLNSTPNTAFRVELFSNDACDPSGYGEGKNYLGFVNVTTDGAGNASLNATVPTPVTGGWVITSTATDPSNNTSEFSACQLVIPTFTINDVSVGEANGPASFTVTLAPPSVQAVTVHFATADGTATAPADYASSSGTKTFNPGVTTQTVSVPIVNDTLHENNESFVVNLTSPVNAVIGDNQGQGTIVDDDPPPSISINDVSHPEGNSGTTPFVFTVSLSTASGLPASVNWATATAPRRHLPITRPAAAH